MIPYTTEYAMSEFTQHGELRLMSNLPQMHTIFDVGCNVGEWTRMARSIHTAAHIHMFEMVPATFDKMLHNGVLDIGTHPNSFGLSDKTDVCTFRYTPENDRVATQVTEINHANSFLAYGLTMTGDHYCQMRDIGNIDFLKIDTEGHEYQVLQGFKYMLSTQRIRVIQFEYGYTAILTKNLLVDFYKMLQDHYMIGKLTPHGVQFKEYHLLDEDFKGPDYVAVLRQETDIIDRIKA